MLMISSDLEEVLGMSDQACSSCTKAASAGKLTRRGLRAKSL